MSNIRDMISDAVALCIEVGREPMLIVIHPKVFCELIDEFDEYRLMSDVSRRMIKRDPSFHGFYRGMMVIVNSRVKDFFIVDDRSWAEQVADRRV